MPEFTVADLNELAAEIERRRAAGTFTPPISAAPAPAPPPAAPAPASKPKPATLEEFQKFPGVEKEAIRSAHPKLEARLIEEWHQRHRISPRGPVRCGGGSPTIGNAGQSVETATAVHAAAQARRQSALKAELAAATGAAVNAPSTTSAAFRRMTTMQP